MHPRWKRIHIADALLGYHLFWLLLFVGGMCTQRHLG